MLHAPRADRDTPFGAPVAPDALVPSPVLPDDATLLARLAAGESGALGALYDRHGRQAFAVAYRIVQSPEVAEEVVHDAFLALWRRAGQFTPVRGNVRGWLLTIVRNRALDQLRARQARPQRAAGAHDFAGLLADPSDTEGTVLAVLEASAVRAAVARLPPAQRQTVELAYFGGLTHTEVAAAQDAPLSTVKRRLALGLKKLAVVLAAQRVAP